MDSWPEYDPGRPLYSVRTITQPPGKHTGSGPFAKRLGEVAKQAKQERAAARKAPKGAPADAQVGPPVPSGDDEPYPGAARVLRWATHVVLSAGYDQRHPMSNKVEVTLQLRHLASEVGLQPKGVAWIAALCGKRRVAFLRVCTPTAESAVGPRLLGADPPRGAAGTAPAATRCAW